MPIYFHGPWHCPATAKPLRNTHGLWWEISMVLDSLHQQQLSSHRHLPCCHDEYSVTSDASDLSHQAQPVTRIEQSSGSPHQYLAICLPQRPRGPAAAAVECHLQSTLSCCMSFAA